MPDIVRWEDPPERGGPINAAELLATLRGKPGEWALVRNCRTSGSRRGIQQRLWDQLLALPGGSRVQLRSAGTKLYARFVEGAPDA